MSKIRAFAELTRPANVVTALSDIIAGLLGLAMLIYELRVFKKIIANEKATSLS